MNHFVCEEQECLNDMLGVAGVESALWSLLLSLAICVATVSVFTAHPLLLLPVLITILGKGEEACFPA